MGKLIDLTGKKFGKLTVIYRENRKSDNQYYWTCQCECGTNISTTGRRLREGDAISCHLCSLIDLSNRRIMNWTIVKRDDEKQIINGQYNWICQCECGTLCSIRQSILTGNGKYGRFHCKDCDSKITKKQADNIIGIKYNHLTVLERNWDIKDKSKVYWYCQCDCELQTIITVSGNALKTGKIKSCGHLKEKYFKEILQFYNNHGFFTGYIYQIKNLINNKIYIGMTNAIDKRKNQHFSKLERNKHQNTFLQNDFNIHKRENFEFSILHKIKFAKYLGLSKKLLNLEKNIIFYTKPYYNIVHSKNQITENQNVLFFEDEDWQDESNIEKIIENYKNEVQITLEYLNDISCVIKFDKNKVKDLNIFGSKIASLQLYLYTKSIAYISFNNEYTGSNVSFAY